MSLFGLDPRDELIKQLTDERNYLRAQVEQLQSQLLAIHNANAFRLLHHSPDANPLPSTPPVLSVFEQKGSVYEPKFTLSELVKKSKGQLD